MSQSHAALIRAAADSLGAAGVADPMRDAQLLMRWATGLEGAVLSTAMQDICTPAHATTFAGAVARRAAREPLSHITGRREFYNHSFRVTPDVLDPRPETETLVHEALHRGPFRRVLDLGTGSGCILISLLVEWPGATGMGVDTSKVALDVARANAVDAGVDDRTTLWVSDWFASVDGTFDLIVSNPPYIAEAEMPELSPEVRDHEPRAALTPGGDGLQAYRDIGAGAKRVLSPEGWLMVEIGPTQSESVAAILAGSGLIVHGIIPDLDQRPRVILAKA